MIPGDNSTILINNLHLYHTKYIDSTRINMNNLAIKKRYKLGLIIVLSKYNYIINIISKWLFRTLDFKGQRKYDPEIQSLKENLLNTN